MSKVKTKFMEEVGLLSGRHIRDRCTDIHAAQRKRNRRLRKNKVAIPDFNSMIVGFSELTEHKVRQPRPGQKKVREKIISYGVSDASYIARASRSFRVELEGSHTDNFGRLNPKISHAMGWVDGGMSFDLPPSDIADIELCELLNLPRDVVAIPHVHPDYARLGLICLSGPFYPKGLSRPTIRVMNTRNRHITIYLEEGICEFMFFRTVNEATSVVVADRDTIPTNHSQ